jgi:hypothetical protein
VLLAQLVHKDLKELLELQELRVQQEKMLSHLQPQILLNLL